MKPQKPILKPIGNLVGFFGKNTVKTYLTWVFNEIGFVPDDDAAFTFASFKGVVNGKKIKIHFAILVRSKYTGVDANRQVRYRTFQGLRMDVSVDFSNPTRLIISKKPKGVLLKLITKVVMKYKNFKPVKSTFIYRKEHEAWSPDILFANAFLNHSSIIENLDCLTKNKTTIKSWGIIINPVSFSFGTTFINLNDFDPEKIKNRLEKIVEIVLLSQNLVVSKKLNPTKAERLAQKDPKALARKGLVKVLLFVLIVIVLIFAFISVILIVLNRSGSF